MVFRSRDERTLAEFEKILSADTRLATLVTLFAEPPRPAAPRRWLFAVPWRLVRLPAALRRTVLLAVGVLAALGGAVVFALVGPAALGVVCGVLAGAGLVFLLAEVVGGKSIWPSDRRRNRIPETRQAHPQRRE